MPETEGPEQYRPPQHSEIRDQQLEMMLLTSGISFPPDRRPRGIASTAPTTRRYQAANLLGSPLYLYSPELESNDIVRLHEMTHGFVQAHLVPNQPSVPIRWNEITAEEAIALTQEDFMHGRGSLVETLQDLIKDKLNGESTNYREDPLPHLHSLAAEIDVKREQRSRFEHIRAHQGIPVTPVPFEAAMAGVNQRLVGSLRELAYTEFGIPEGRDFEEAVATYFAHHAAGRPLDETADFQQGERAKAYTQALAERYPDPHALAELLEQSGMLGVLDRNADLFNTTNR